MSTMTDPGAPPASGRSSTAIPTRPWLLTATRRRYRGGVDVTAEFVVEDTPYHFILTNRKVTIRRGPLARPDVRVRLSEDLLVRLLLEGWPHDAVQEGLEVEGEIERLRVLIDAFDHPAGPVPRARAG